MNNSPTVRPDFSASYSASTLATGNSMSEGEFVDGTGKYTEWYGAGMGANVRSVATFVEGVMTQETVFWPATANIGATPIGPEHLMSVRSWVVLPGGSKPVPDGVWIYYKLDGSVENTQRFRNSTAVN